MRLALDHPGTFHSPLAGFDPRWKMVSIVLLAVVVIFLRNFTVAQTALALSFGLVAYARLPDRWYWRRLGMVGLLAGLFLVWLPFLEPGPVWNFGWLYISQKGVSLALLLLCKTLAVTNVFLVLWATSPPGATLKAAQALHVPGIILHLFSLTYRYLHLFAEELARIRLALRVRGYRRRSAMQSYRMTAGVAGILLVRSFERAERVTHAMRCRGFDGRYRSLTAFHSRFQDYAAALLSLLVATGLLLWDLAL